MRCWGEVIRQKFQEQNLCLHGVVTRSCFLWTHVRPGRFFSVDLGNLGCRMILALTLGDRDFIGGREQIKFTAVCLLTTGDPGAIAHFGNFGTQSTGYHYGTGGGMWKERLGWTLSCMGRAKGTDLGRWSGRGCH